MKIKRSLTALVAACIAYIYAAVYWTQSNQAGEYLSLTLYKPFVYRQLIPMLARALTWLGVSANMAIVLVMAGAGVGFYFALRALIFEFYHDAGRLDLWALLLFILGLSLFWFERLPSDWMTGCLFALAFLFLAQSRLAAYMLLYPIVCFNRETAFLLTVFYLVWMLRKTRRDLWRDGLIFCYQVLIWFAVRIGLMLIFARNGGLNAWIYPLQNMLKFFQHPWHSLLHIGIFAGLLFLVFKGWKRKPLFLRLAFLTLAPLLLIMYWILGQPWEVRVLWEVYPVTAVLLLPAGNFKVADY